MLNMVVEYFGFFRDDMETIKRVCRWIGKEKSQDCKGGNYFGYSEGRPPSMAGASRNGFYIA
jgi:hypothetical protein